MDIVEKLYRILVGKHLQQGEKIAPGINDWNIELTHVKDNDYLLTFHGGKKGLVTLDVQDLEIISSLFFTKDLNIGEENKVHNGCKTCDHGSDYQVKVHINKAGVTPKVNRNFCFAWIKREILPTDKFYYRNIDPAIKTQCIETYKEHQRSLELI